MQNEGEAHNIINNSLIRVYYAHTVELSRTLERDCGMGKASRRVRVAKDFGEGEVKQFEGFVDEFS